MSSKFSQYWGRIKSLFVAGQWRDVRQKFLCYIPADFLSNVSWQYGGTLASSALAFLYTIVVARALGAAEFGLMAMGLAFAAIVSQFVNVNLREVVIRYIAKFHAEKDLPRTLAMTKLTLLLDAAAGVAAMLLILALAPVGKAWLLKDERAFLVIAVAGCAYVLQNVADDTALGLLRVFGRFRALALTEVVASVLKLAGAMCVIWWLGWGIVGVLLVLLATNFLVNVLRLALALRELRKKIPLLSPAPFSLLASHRGEIISHLKYNYLRSISNFATRDLDINILGIFAPKSTVGIYKVARSFGQVLYQFADAAFMVVYPEIAKLWSLKRFAELKSFLKRLSLLMAGSGIVLYGAAFFVVPWIVDHFMQPEFADAGLLFRWMGWGIIIWSPFVWAGPLLLSAGRPDLLLRTSLGTGLSVLGLYFVMCWWAGAPGAAIVTALRHTIGVSITLWSGRRAGVIFPGEEDDGGPQITQITQMMVNGLM